MPPSHYKNSGRTVPLGKIPTAKSSRLVRTYQIALHGNMVSLTQKEEALELVNLDLEDGIRRDAQSFIPHVPWTVRQDRLSGTVRLLS